MNSLAQDHLLITFKNWVSVKQLLSYELQQEHSEVSYEESKCITLPLISAFGH